MKKQGDDVFDPEVPKPGERISVSWQDFDGTDFLVMDIFVKYRFKNSEGQFVVLDTIDLKTLKLVDGKWLIYLPEKSPFWDEEVKVTRNQRR